MTSAKKAASTAKRNASPTKKVGKSPAPTAKKPRAADAEPKRGATAKDAERPTATAAASDLTKYGEPQDVPFGLLRSNDNVRRIRAKDAQDEMNLSVAKDGTEERMTVYKAPDGTYPVISGSRRHMALSKSGYSPDALISVIVKPAPLTRADDRLMGLKANMHRSTEWPDTAIAVGEAIGTIDQFGNVRPDEEVRAGRANGLYKTPKQAAEALGKSEELMNHYARASRAPYDDLVKIFEAGGSLAHGETYASYADKDKPAALKHYLQSSPHSWPETIVPERRRAPGAGRKTNLSKGLPLKHSQTVAGSDRQRAIGAGRPTNASKGLPTRSLSGLLINDPKTKADDTPTATPTSSTPALASTPTSSSAPAAVDPRQTSFLDPSPAPARVSLPHVRPANETMIVADDLGMPLDLVLFLDAVADYWDPGEPYALWHKDNRDKIETAYEVLRQSAIFQAVL